MPSSNEEPLGRESGPEASADAPEDGNVGQRRKLLQLVAGGVPLMLGLPASAGATGIGGAATSAWHVAKRDCDHPPSQTDCVKTGSDTWIRCKVGKITVKKCTNSQYRWSSHSWRPTYSSTGTDCYHVPNYPAGSNWGWGYKQNGYGGGYFTNISGHNCWTPNFQGGQYSGGTCVRQSDCTTRLTVDDGDDVVDNGYCYAVVLFDCSSLNESSCFPKDKCDGSHLQALHFSSWRSINPQTSKPSHWYCNGV